MRTMQNLLTRCLHSFEWSEEKIGTAIRLSLSYYRSVSSLSGIEFNFPKEIRPGFRDVVRPNCPN